MRRQQGYHRLRILIAVAVVVVVIGGGVGAVFSPLLAVRHLRVTGASHVPASEITTLSRLKDHEPMIEVDDASISRRLDALPWVASARVSRTWPSTVRISVTERRPVAVVAGAASLAGASVEVDATGRALAVAGGSTPTLPRLQAAPAVAALGGWLPGTSDSAPLPQGRIGAALAVAAALPAAVAGHVSTITVGSGNQVTLALTPGPTQVILGQVIPGGPPPAGSTDDASLTLARQVAALATLLTTIDLSTIGQIDLTVPDRPALTPA